MTMIMVALVSSILASLVICRALVVKSESECFATLWHKAILSEYDRHLLEDYGVLAFYGSEKDVNSRLTFYSMYSCKGKLDADIGKPSSALGAYTLADPKNFIKSLKNQFGADAAASIISNQRTKRIIEESSENHIIANQVVIDTLPSKGVGSSISAKDIGKQLSDEGGFEAVGSTAGNYAIEMAFVKNHLGNHIYSADLKKSYLSNEWEYVIEGKLSDEDNYKGCRRKIFVIRNLLNLASLYKDAEKMAAILEISEIITPGPAALLTQTIIAEAWAAAEAEEDLNKLYNYGRVPVIKGPGDWAVSLRSVIESDDVSSKLDEEARKQLSDNEEQISETIDSIKSVAEEIKEGQTYEDYLMLLMLAMNDNVRLLRIMDIVQINMKSRYYADFNMEEYYIGADIAIEANGRTYEAEGTYR